MEAPMQSGRYNHMVTGANVQRQWDLHVMADEEQDSNTQILGDSKYRMDMNTSYCKPKHETASTGEGAGMVRGGV
jgi:hypothetical protein